MSSQSLSRASAVVVAIILAGCQSAPPGFANNSAGRAGYHRFCTAVLSFVRAPVDTSGLRRAWFLPFVYNDERIDMYAPMKADPSDELALAFYNDGGAQLTHYVFAPEYAKAFSSCLTKQDGFTRVVWRPSGKAFHAELKEEQYVN